MKIWTDKDFDELDFHDNIIYSIYFPEEEPTFKLRLDYILQWKLNKKTNLYSFTVASAKLLFKGVYNLKLNLDFQNNVGISIFSIVRENKRLSPNKTAYVWDYIIETDRGSISFESSGFILELLNDPISGNSQKYGG